MAAGTLPISHQALDAHQHRQAADYLRQVLVANDVLPPRDWNRYAAELARTSNHQP